MHFSVGLTLKADRLRGGARPAELRGDTHGEAVTRVHHQIAHDQLALVF